MKEDHKLPPLERYFRILELLSAHPGGLALIEVARMLALPKATAHRLLATMQNSGLVALNSSGAAYVTGDRVRRLALLSTDEAYIETLTSSLLRDLSEEIGETCYVARLEGTQVRSVVMESPDAPWRGFVLPGKTMQPNATACSKAILAFHDEAFIDRALADSIVRLTDRTKTDPAAIKAELAQVRAQGYATCIGEVDEALAAVAVPVEVQPAGVVFSLGVVGPMARILRLIEEDIPKRLTTIADAIALALAKGDTAAVPRALHGREASAGA
ncbi:transcriptional regulator [Azorhizobium oxalatiphilum]|uniref:Transcriptional regulator n=1 Tax=Azorhizobium oxalatiphilum TaxID=980631 RepID=A0A917FD98_9HYPH|nr:IclR family transcriptional regulator [Azorhizobium oxalatiphilum]GGF70131.1 transcriptional regulator [Azorhizobium oxalatiphilum]